MAFKKEPWSWMRALQVAKSNGNYLEIDWRWRNDQKRGAAIRACKRGFLKRIKGRPGADYFIVINKFIEVIDERPID